MQSEKQEIIEVFNQKKIYIVQYMVRLPGVSITLIFSLAADFVK